MPRTRGCGAAKGPFLLARSVPPYSVPCNLLYTLYGVIAVMDRGHGDVVDSWSVGPCVERTRRPGRPGHHKCSRRTSESG